MSNMPPYAEPTVSTIAEDDNPALSPTRKLSSATDAETIKTSVSFSSEESTSATTSRERADSDNVSERRATAANAAARRRRSRSRVQSMPEGSAGAQNFFGAPQGGGGKPTEYETDLPRLAKDNAEDTTTDPLGPGAEAKEVAVVRPPSPMPQPPPTYKLVMPSDGLNPKASTSPPANASTGKVDAGCQCIIL